MLCCETARLDAEGFDDLAVLVSQLAALGLPAVIGAGSIPPELSRGRLFDAAPHVRRDPPGEGDALLLVRGHDIDEGGLARLRRLAPRPGLRTLVLARAPTFQARIGLQMRLSYALGQSPEILDLPGGLGAGRHHLPVLGARGAPAPRRDARPAVLLVGPDLSVEPQVQALLALAASPSVAVTVLTDGRAKHALVERFGQIVPIYHGSELLPAELAALPDLALLFAPPSGGYRAQSLLANLAARGVPLVDCSPGWGHARIVDAMVEGPTDLGGAATFLAGGILDALPMIGREVARSRFVAALDGDEVLAALRRPAAPAPRPTLVAVEAPAPAAPAPPDAPAIVMVPTNGVGLGHAQRCSLIAGAMGAGGARPAFAAFPSCMRMLKSYGFDVMPLVGRSTWHRHDHENDLVNYLRLRRLTRGSDTLVFDGGYVFDSIYRSVLENRLSGVWIRRGLWQEGQANQVALDREKAFRRVIVPLEAFEELNGAYSRGGHVRTVGPVVQRLGLTDEDRGAIRDGLAARYGRDFRHLAVTMLGGGVAADRSAQVAAACAAMAARPDTLHLVVVWPTATVEAGAFAWPNTRVVKTHHASLLVACADLYLSAVGYNSFHEALYNGVPTIFLAQMAAFMDDQRRRAQAAADRGLALLVEPEEMQTLRRLVADMLDGGLGPEIRARLAETPLPEPGTAEAARLILEVAECPQAAGRVSSPVSPATSPTTSTTSCAPAMPAPPASGPTSSRRTWA